MEIEIAGHTLRLFADGAAYDPSARTLFIADLHFGKTAFFRDAGLALPDGPDATVLARLSHLIAETGAATLVLLGDVFHARASGIECALAVWRDRHPQLHWRIVPGNHDRRIPWSEWLPGAEVLAEGDHAGLWRVAHHPPDDDGALTLCGHLHPGIAIGKARERKFRVPCFWLRHGALILPAFGEFTGLQMIKRECGDRVWIASSGKIVELSSLGKRATRNCGGCALR